VNPWLTREGVGGVSGAVREAGVAKPKHHTITRFPAHRQRHQPIKALFQPKIRRLSREYPLLPQFGPDLSLGSQKHERG